MGCVIVMVAVFSESSLCISTHDVPWGEATMLSGLSKGKGVVKGARAQGDRGASWGRMGGMGTG